MTDKQDTKRRISNGAPLLAISEADLVETVPTKKKLSGRRKSSLGPSNPTNPVQNDSKKENLVEMYSKIIKLSTENKITAKNSWDLDIEAVVNDIMTPQEKEAHRRESRNKFGSTNFQRASCGIDASVKIYSCRVDDTWSSSYRVLNHIAGNAEEVIEEGDEAEAQDENKGGDDDEDSGKPKKAKAKKQRNNNNGDYTKTIEKNIASISMGNNEKQGSCGSDLLACSRLSRMIECGSRQLLLNTLPIAENCCVLTLGSGDLPLSEKDKEKFQPNIADQLKSLRQKISNVDSCDSLCKYITLKREARLPPKLVKQATNDFDREMKAVQAKLSSIVYTLRPVHHEIVENIVAPSVSVAKSSPSSLHQSPVVDVTDNDVPMTCDDYYDDIPVCEVVSEKRSSTAPESTANRKSSTSSAGQSTVTASSASHDLLNKVLEQVGSSSASEYAYFDVQNMAGMTDWSRMDHWVHAKNLMKKTKRDESKMIKSKNDDDDDEEEDAATKTKKTRKTTKILIDFTAPPPSKDCFEIPIPSKRSSLDPTQLSSATIDRLLKQASSKVAQATTLAKFELKDLCTLFCRPKHVVDILQDFSTDEKKHNINMKSVFSSSLGNGKSDRKSICLSSGYELRQDYADVAIDNDQGEWIGCDDEARTEVSAPGPTAPSPVQAQQETKKEDEVEKKPTVQDYWNDKLTKKDVLKVAKGPTIINLKKLKRDVWNHVEENIMNEEPSTFASMIKSVSGSQSQKDVSVQFYFITLLHLANEKRLVLNDEESSENDGFTISSLN